MGSKRDLRCAIVHEGLILRSEDELGELIMRGTSATLWSDMSACGRLPRMLWGLVSSGRGYPGVAWEFRAVVSGTLVRGVGGIPDGEAR